MSNRALSMRAVRKRPKTAGFEPRRLIKRSLLKPAHNWHGGRYATDDIWNRGKGYIGLVKAAFLLHVIDGKIHRWRQSNATCAANDIQETIPFSGGSVICF